MTQVSTCSGTPSQHAPVRVTTRRLAQEVKWGECGSRSSYEAITAPASPVAAFTPFPGSRDRILLNRPPHNAPAITPSRNALRMTPESVKPQAFYMLSSLPRGRRDMRSRRDPKNRCEICSPTARNRAPGSQNYRHPRRPRCSGSRSARHPLCETYHGENGEFNQGQHFPIL
jgi:hypothetical protein